jgi:filamentous hemagglutinin
MDLTEHFVRHPEFGVATEAEYLELADAFLGGPLNPALTRQCIRRNGDRLRYNEFTEEFGILRIDGVIKTYYRPDPAVHGQGGNLAYFFSECRK